MASLYGEPRDGWKHSGVPFDRVLGWQIARHEQARLAQEARTGRPAYKWNEPRETHTGNQIRNLVDGKLVPAHKDNVYFVQRVGMGGYNIERGEAYRTIYVPGAEEHKGKLFFIGYYKNKPRETLVWEKINASG